MTPDELKSIPKGQFVVTKTGTHPMQTRLRLFLDWGITFGEQYQTPDHGKRKVYYADRRELEAAILKKYPPARVEIVPPPTSQAAPRPRPRPSTRPTEGDSSPRFTERWTICAKPVSWKRGTAGGRMAGELQTSINSYRAAF